MSRMTNHQDCESIKDILGPLLASLYQALRIKASASITCVVALSQGYVQVLQEDICDGPPRHDTCRAQA